MTNYDGEDRRVLSHTEMDARAGAEVDEEHKDQPESPRRYVDSESLASHNLKVIRKRLGVSQQQIAERLPHVFGGLVRLAQTQIAKIERGERPWRVNEMFAIAEALDISWHELFRGGPLEEGENDDHLLMLGARIKYQQAQRKTEEAKEAWEKAAREELEAGMEMARTAAELEIVDTEVMQFLQLRGATRIWMGEEEQDRLDRWQKGFDLDARAAELQARGLEAWNELLTQVREEKQAAKEQQEEEDGAHEGE
ncbi:helix-turn-helix transcriptional regulator [Streptomyces wuyuanensis]|uniref:helix-turn-helix transcriptional regulator n=1 Tax=Streptomyces wuyuanensis TaxID=1196353 RepID=UPI003443EB7E